MNIYFATESATKLQNLIINYKNFYIFDVQEFLQQYTFDIKQPCCAYIINNDITALITQVSKLKKYQGIIYINKNLSESLYRNLKKKFGNDEHIDKFVLIDNGNVPKHKELHDVFEEVFFYERFRKNKIVDCSGLIPMDAKMLKESDS